MEDVVDVHGEGASGVCEAWSVACFSVGRGETTGEPLICIGDGCVVEVTANDNGVAGVAVDECADAVGLSASVGGCFAQFAYKHSRTAFDGLAMRVGNGVGVFVFLLWAQLVAFEMAVDDEHAVARTIYPTGQAVVVAGREVDVYGVAQERKPREDGDVADLQ